MRYNKTVYIFISVSGGLVGKKPTIVNP